MKLYHGTIVRRVSELQFGTSRRVYVTAYRPLAIMYALLTADELDGVPAVVVIKTKRHLEPDPEHFPVPSDRAYILEGLRQEEFVTVQSKPEWLLRLAEYRVTGVIDEDVLE